MNQDHKDILSAYLAVGAKYSEIALAVGVSESTVEKVISTMMPIGKLTQEQTDMLAFCQEERDTQDVVDHLLNQGVVRSYASVDRALNRLANAGYLSKDGRLFKANSL